MVRGAGGAILRRQAVMSRFARASKGLRKVIEQKIHSSGPPYPLTSCGYVWSIVRSAANSVRPESREDSVVGESRGAPHKNKGAYRLQHAACLKPSLPRGALSAAACFIFGASLSARRCTDIYRGAREGRRGGAQRKWPPERSGGHESREETPRRRQ